MNIKVLGTGCPKCQRLEYNVNEALKRSNQEATVEKVTNIEDILSYGVMSTPALVIDGIVVSSGKLVKPNDIIELMHQKTSNQ